MSDLLTGPPGLSQQNFTFSLRERICTLPPAKTGISSAFPVSFRRPKRSPAVIAFATARQQEFKNDNESYPQHYPNDLRVGTDSTTGLIGLRTASHCGNRETPVRRQSCPAYVDFLSRRPGQTLVVCKPGGVGTCPASRS